ncbi:MAG: alkaline phosphatase family protein [Candidatus Bathyarchaeia archaeon]|nr:alkaline phosphatase family protein [Candidatus Bathyarchaeota archaeon]
MAKPSRAVLIGLDAPIAGRVYDYAKRGLLPYLKKLIDDGVYAENYLVPYPTVTPENWTTIATGARIGTHGVTGFWIHIPGDDIYSVRSAWNTSLCRAEYLWDTAERFGLKSIIINWPCSYPATVRYSYQLWGTGLAPNEWRTDRERGILYVADLADGQLFSTEDLPFASRIYLRKASGWIGLDQGMDALEAELKLSYSVCRKAGEDGERHAKIRSPDRWFMLVLNTSGLGYDRILIAKSKSIGDVFTELSPECWSPTIVDEFQTDDGVRKGAFRFKLLELSRDGSRVRLLVTPICNVEGYSYPPDLSAEFSKVNPLAPPSHIFFDGLGWGWYDIDTYLELIEMEHRCLADAAVYLMKSRDWNLLFMHMHAPDWMYHYAIPIEKWDPSSRFYEGEEKAKLYEKVELETYRIIDRAIGRIAEAAGSDSLIVVVSDHGARARGYEFSPIEALAEAGLLVFKETGSGRIIDIENSLAIPAHGPWIYINLKGIYRHGVVDPSRYEEIQDRIIDALYSYTDPETGRKPIALAVKKRDAALLGLYGDRIGDVVYAVRDDYGEHHGQLPTCEYGLGSLKGLLIISGPGVKKGMVLKRIVYAVDIAPTICYLLGIPPPRDTEGSIIYQILDEHPHQGCDSRDISRSGRASTLGSYQIES